MTDPGRVVYAPVGEAVFRALMERISAARARNGLGPITVVMPTFYSAFFGRRYLGARDRGLFNVNFMRLDDLAVKLAPAADGRAPLTRLRASEMVFAITAEASAGDLGPLARMQGHPSLPAALHAAFDELRPVSDDELRRLIAADGSGIAEVVGRLRERFKDRSVDYTDQLRTSVAAAEALREPGSVAIETVGPLIVALLEDPTPQFRPLLDALVEYAGAEFVVGLTLDEGADRRVIAAVDRLRGDAPADSTSVEPANQTILVSVPDPGEEVRTLVRNILRFAGEGTQFGEMAVLYQNSEYAARLDEAFRAAGIPVAGGDPLALAATPEGRFILGAASVFDESFSREAVIDWLTGSPVSAPDGGTVNAARWDLISRQAGVVGGADQWESRLSTYATRSRNRADDIERRAPEDELAARSQRAEADECDRLRRFVSDLIGNEPPEAGSWSEFAAWAHEILAGYLAEEGDDAEHARHRERVDRIVDRLGQLDEVAGPEPSRARFLEVLKEELAGSAGTVRNLGRGVFVAPVRDGVGAPFRVVFIVGMSEGSYPGVEREDALLPDGLRRLAGADESVLPTRSVREAMARRSYLTAIASAPVRVLSWPRSEAGSSSLRGPSRWFLEAAREKSGDETLQGSDLIKHEEGDWLEVVRSPEHGLEAAAGEVLGTGREYELKSVSATVAAGGAIGSHWLAADGAARGFRRSLETERARFGPEWTAWDGRLLGEAVPAPSVESPISPTRLETWAACPYRYFAGYVLGLTAIPRPEELASISPLDRGSLIHSILDQFVQWRLGRSGSSDEEQRASIFEIAKAEFSDYEERGLTGKPALWRLEQERILRELDRFLEAERARVEETGFRAVDTELKFGLGADTSPALELTLPGGRVVAFRGAIDRVERADDGRLAVLDYKTGSSGPYSGMKDDPLEGGQRMQLPVYAMAARMLLSPEGDVEGAYWFTSERGGFELRRISLDEVEKDALDAMGRITSGIAAGVFPARPGKSRFSPPGAPGSAFDNCVYCDFDRICPVSRDRLWRQKRTDAAIREAVPEKLE